MMTMEFMRSMQPDAQLREVVQRHIGSRWLGEVAGVCDLLPQPVP